MCHKELSRDTSLYVMNLMLVSITEKPHFALMRYSAHFDLGH